MFKALFGTWWNAVLQTFCIAVNVLGAAFDLHRHRFGNTAISIGVIAFLILINILGAQVRKKHQLVLTALRERHALMIQGIEERVMSQDATEKAKRNLELVVKALGATVVGTRMHFKTGKQYFAVAPGAAYRCDADGGIMGSTCIQNEGLPIQEVMAATMLLLKHNPAIFDRWRLDPGNHYGA